MAACRIVVKVEGANGAPGDALANVWVYWKEGDSTTILHANDEGLLQALQGDGPPTLGSSYTAPFTSAPGTKVKVHYSTGSKPTPAARLDENADAFIDREVPKPQQQQAPVTLAVAPNQLNTLKASAVLTAVVTVPPARVTLETPKELSVWPLLWDPLPKDYQTDGLPQGADAWATIVSGHPPKPHRVLVPRENTAATPAADKLRPKERGLVVKGQIDAAATGAQVQVVDKAGKPIDLRASATATDDLPWLDATLAAPAGELRPFSAVIRVAKAGEKFGPVQILVRTTGGSTPRRLGSFTVSLTGVQIALVQDERDGQKPQPPFGEAKEEVVVDFRDSPRASRAEAEAQTRVRRMVQYFIDLRTRGTKDEPDKQILRPEMPMWMVELHLLGVQKADLEELFIRRAQAKPPLPTKLKLGLSYTMHLAWAGPDVGTKSKRLYSYHIDVPHSCGGKLELDDDGKKLKGAGENGLIVDALDPAPTQVPYPVENRRRAGVKIDQERPWGRKEGAVTSKGTVLEWQPRIEVLNKEVMRGGDGQLSLELTIDDARVDRGVLGDGSTEAIPDAAVPTFRIPGKNPPPPANHRLSPECAALADQLIEDYYNAHRTDDYVMMLELRTWQGTIKRIMGHEAGVQFDHKGSKILAYKQQYYGFEGNLPIFGPPHGYGMGQHDSPPVSHDGCWSFLENMKESIRRFIEDKGGEAYSDLGNHFSQPPTAADRAVFRREAVRRYNGCKEFKWNATKHQFEIHPTNGKWEDDNDHSKGANSRLGYCNKVLGTSVAYSHGTGAATTFPFPITFTADMYGPDL